MSSVFDAIVPLASCMTGGGAGFLSARAEHLIEVQDKKDARESNERLEALRMANGVNKEQSQINIQATHHVRFFGIRWGEAKKFGIELSSHAETLLMSPVNVCKFIIGFMLTYTYCYIWQYNARHPQEIVRTVLPEPDKTTYNFFGLFDYTRMVHVIAELNLGGLSATTMASAPLFIVCYLVTNLTYQKIGGR